MSIQKKCFSLLVIVIFVNGQDFDNEPKVRGTGEFRRIDRLIAPAFIGFRRMLWRAAGSTKDLMKENMKDHMTQKALHKIRPEYVNNFPCDIETPGKRSNVTPTNIYELRPGDIDIIAAMGDSLSSGNGGFSNNILHIPNEFRSISFSGGGKGDYNNYITLPNILKVFNPNLYGYATVDGISIEKGAKFNLAEPMAMSADLVYQAKTLINRMKTDPNVDMEKHWKMLTIFMGNNDFCSDSCHYKSYEEWVSLHEMELIKCLRVLRDNVPNLIVNIIGLPNYTIMYKTKNTPLRCYAIYRVGCHCLFQPHMNEKKLKIVKKGIDLWNARDKAVTFMEEFHTDNFAAIFQPYMTNVTFFTDEKNGIADFTYMANDCFHFSQLGHAMAAVGIWQNLMEYPDNKTVHWNPTLTKVLQLNCPTKESPYIKVPRKHHLSI